MAETEKRARAPREPWIIWTYAGFGDAQEAKIAEHPSIAGIALIELLAADLARNGEIEAAEIGTGSV
jgi:hypothetical protein